MPDTHERCERCGTDTAVIRFGVRRLCSGLCGPIVFGADEWAVIAKADSQDHAEEGSPASRPPSVSEVDTMANVESQPESCREGATTSLDMSNERDRGLVRQTIKNRPKRWRGLDDSLKDELLNGLKEANRVARAHLTDPEKSLEAAKVVGQLVKTGAVMEAQHQSDDHLEAKNERLDEGKPTDVVVIQPPTRARIDQ